MSDQMFEKCLMLKDREKSVETIILLMHCISIIYKRLCEGLQEINIVQFFCMWCTWNALTYNTNM